MKNKQLKKLIKGKKKKYTWKTKEIIMLQLLWYLGPLLISLAKDYNLPNIPEFESFFYYSFLLVIKLLIITYLVYTLLFKHNLSLSKIGLALDNYTKDLKLGLKVSYPLPILTILLINLQHQHLTFDTTFQPLVRITSIDELTSSILYFIILSLLSIIPALATELFYRIIIYNYFKERIGIIFGTLASSLYYALSLLEFNFGFLLHYFIIGIIAVYLYERNNSLISSIIWQSFYQTTSILYIFGFQIF